VVPSARSAWSSPCLGYLQRPSVRLRDRLSVGDSIDVSNWVEVGKFVKPAGPPASTHILLVPHVRGVAVILTTVIDPGTEYSVVFSEIACRDLPAHHRGRQR